MLVGNLMYDQELREGRDFCREGIPQYVFYHFTARADLIVCGETIQVGPNACIIYKPGEIRQYHNYAAAKQNWLYLTKSAQELLEKYEIPLNTVFYVEDPSFIWDMLRIMDKEKALRRIHWKEILDGYAQEFVIKLHRSLYEENLQVSVGQNARTQIRNVHSVILNHPEKKWTIQEMADMAMLSPSRFHAVYKTVIGRSPMKTVKIVKMDMAKKLLTTDDSLTLQMIAQRLGYKSQFHFIHQFKETVGISPGEYRKKY